MICPDASNINPRFCTHYESCVSSALKTALSSDDGWSESMLYASDTLSDSDISDVCSNSDVLVPQSDLKVFRRPHHRDFRRCYQKSDVLVDP
jgi:hypothetical protein